MRKLGVTLGGTPIIVTGACGSVGTLLRRAWGATPPQGMVVLSAARRQDVDIPWDIEAGPVPRWPEGAIILHLAAAVRAPADQMGRNLVIARNLAKAAAKNRARLILAASTAAVYAPTSDPATEETPPAPLSAYGQSKVEAETVLRAECQTSGIPVSVLRIANLVGADALIGARRATDPPVLLDPVPGQPRGPLRSWIGPVSLARAIEALCRIGAGERPPVLNLTQGPPLAMADLLDAAGLSWSFGPPNPRVVPAAVMDGTRLAALCPLPPATAGGLIAELRSLRDGGLP